MWLKNMNNTTLGQNIKINTFVLNFHGQPAGGVDFVVSRKTHHMMITSHSYIQTVI